MQLSEIVKLDIYKLIKKKSTYLLLLTLLIPLVFGIGMHTEISFLVTDGANSYDVISDKRISAIQFIANMLSQSTYVVYLIIIIIASLLVANEIETGQACLYVVRVCMRKKYIISKFLALVILITGYFLFYVICSVGIYYFLVAESKYGNGRMISNGTGAFWFIMITYVGILVVLALTIWLGIYLKTFHCFALSYLIWFVTKYLNFFENLKYLAPDNYAESVLSMQTIDALPYKWIAIYVVYISIAIIGACYGFEKKDIK